MDITQSPLYRALKQQVETLSKTCEDPVSLQLMENPYSLCATCNHTFDKSSIDQIFHNAQQQGAIAKCPLDRIPIGPIGNVKPNLAMKGVIEIIEKLLVQMQELAVPVPQVMKKVAEEAPVPFSH
jgi:hypothetical protein